MDCVGCEKCRLWGKLQVLGLGTALKILFSVNGHNQPEQSVSCLEQQHISFPHIFQSQSPLVIDQYFPSSTYFSIAHLLLSYCERNCAAAPAKERSDSIGKPA